jgi:hypothetical protein
MQAPSHLQHHGENMPLYVQHPSAGTGNPAEGRNSIERGLATRRLQEHQPENRARNKPEHFAHTCTVLSPTNDLM